MTRTYGAPVPMPHLEGSMLDSSGKLVLKERYLTTPELPFWTIWRFRKRRVLAKLEELKRHALWLCEINQ